MIVGFDANTLQPVAAPSAPPPRVQAPIAPIGERDALGRDPHEQNKGERQQGVDFRSYITASTLEGLGQALGGDDQVRSESETADRPRPSKVPDAGPAILSGAEAANYYQSVSGDSESLIAAREFRDATTSYARNFFANSGVYARPGESLEISA
jgi:hypothetical protein